MTAGGRCPTRALVQLPLLTAALFIVHTTCGASESHAPAPAPPRAAQAAATPAQTCGATPAEEPVLAMLRGGNFTEEDFAVLLRTERDVWADKKYSRALSNHSRNFGEDIYKSKGHQVTYMHGHIAQDKAAFEVANKLDKAVADMEHDSGWGILGSGKFGDNLFRRNFESIRYDVHDKHLGQEENAELKKLTSGKDTWSGENALAWHLDSGSVLSASIMLSDPEDYTGGAFEVQRGSTWHSYSPKRGDITLWRSWERHRVLPIKRGHRHVMVVEWWMGASNDDPAADGRPEVKDVRKLCEAITDDAVDPGSYAALDSCGDGIMKLAQEKALDDKAFLPLHKLAMSYNRRAAEVSRGTVVHRSALLAIASGLRHIILAGHAKLPRQPAWQASEAKVGATQSDGEVRFETCAPPTVPVTFQFHDDCVSAAGPSTSDAQWTDLGLPSATYAGNFTWRSAPWWLGAPDFCQRAMVDQHAVLTTDVGALAVGGLRCGDLFQRPQLEPAQDEPLLEEVFALCGQVHELGEVLKPGESPYDSAMNKSHALLGSAMQQDLYDRVLYPLKYDLAMAGLGPLSKYEERHPYLALYWKHTKRPYGDLQTKGEFMVGTTQAVSGMQSAARSSTADGEDGEAQDSGPAGGEVILQPEFMYVDTSQPSGKLNRDVNA